MGDPGDGPGASAGPHLLAVQCGLQFAMPVRPDEPVQRESGARAGHAGPQRRIPAPPRLLAWHGPLASPPSRAPAAPPAAPAAVAAAAAAAAARTAGRAERAAGRAGLRRAGAGLRVRPVPPQPWQRRPGQRALGPPRAPEEMPDLGSVPRPRSGPGPLGWRDLVTAPPAARRRRPEPCADPRWRVRKGKAGPGWGGHWSPGSCARVRGGPRSCYSSDTCVSPADPLARPGLPTPGPAVTDSAGGCG